MNQRDAPRERAAIIARLRQLATDVRRLTAGFDDATLQRRAVAGQWSLIELVCHLSLVQQLFEQRIGAMLEHDRPAFQSYAPEDDPAFARLIASAPGREAVQTYLMERDRFVSRLEALDEGAWRRTGVHPTFGEFDIEFLVEYLAP
jgi:hypothetical protein